MRTDHAQYSYSIDELQGELIDLGAREARNWWDMTPAAEADDSDILMLNYWIPRDRPAYKDPLCLPLLHFLTVLPSIPSFLSDQWTTFSIELKHRGNRCQSEPAGGISHTETDDLGLVDGDCNALQVPLSSGSVLV